MNSLYKGFIISFAILLASGFASMKLVEKTAANKISSVAVVTVVTRDAMFATNINNQPLQKSM